MTQGSQMKDLELFVLGCSWAEDKLAQAIQQKWSLDSQEFRVGARAVQMIPMEVLLN